MKVFDRLLSSTSWLELFLLLFITWFCYLILKPFDWDGLRARVCVVLLFLFFTVKYITGVAYLQLLSRYIIIEFIDVWISLSISVFYFFLLYRRQAALDMLRLAVIVGAVSFLFLFFFKQVVN